MVPNSERQRRTPKKGLKRKKKKKTQLPPAPPSSDDGFVTDNSPDPTLRDNMSAIGTISMPVATNEKRLAGFHNSMLLPSRSLCDQHIQCYTRHRRHSTPTRERFAGDGGNSGGQDC